MITVVVILLLAVVWGMLVRRHPAAATYFRGGEWQGAGLQDSLNSAWAAGEKVWNDHSDGSTITYSVDERAEEEQHHKIEQRGIEPNHRNDIEDNEPKFDMSGLELHEPYHVYQDQQNQWADVGFGDTHKGYGDPDNLFG